MVTSLPWVFSIFYSVLYDIVHGDISEVHQLFSQRLQTLCEQLCLVEREEKTERSERFNVPALEFPIPTPNTPMCRDSILKWCVHVPTYTRYISSRMHVITAAAPYSQKKSTGRPQALPERGPKQTAFKFRRCFNLQPQLAGTL